jgi:hypothetical protein
VDVVAGGPVGDVSGALRSDESVGDEACALHPGVLARGQAGVDHHPSLAILVDGIDLAVELVRTDQVAAE